MTNKEKTTHRLNVEIPDSLYRVLKNIADRNKTTLTSVVKHALSLEKWYFEAEKSGSVCVERDGELYEFKMRW